MKESIKIKNFGPISNVEIFDIKPFTVFIGESGSGKSAIMKILVLFRWIYKMMCIKSYLKYSGIKKSPFRIKIDNLIRENGLFDYVNNNTEIFYRNGSFEILYKNKTLSGTKSYVKKDELSLEKMAFISDKRNMVSELVESNANVKRMFYLNETYEDYLNATKYINHFDIDYLGVKLEVKKTSQGIRHFIQPMNEDGNYSIKLSEASSGIQNVIPLCLIVEYFAKRYDLVYSMNQAVISYVSKGDNLTSFKAVSNIGDIPHKRVNLSIEEPELSLFPESQMRLMDFLVNRCIVSSVHDYSFTLMLATHSPYIVNYLNVLLSRHNHRENQAYVNGDELMVYRVYEGKIQNLMLHNESNNDWIVDTSDLSEPMSEILTEYHNLRADGVAEG